MTKKLTTFDKIQRSFFSEPGAREVKLTPAQEKIKERLMKAFTYWINSPTYSESQIVRFLVNECDVNRAQAYKDIKYIKIILGNVTNANKQWIRYIVNDTCLKAIRLARHNGDAKGMAIAADKLGKYNQLDKPELDQLPWDQMVPPNFEPSPDISILGFKPDPRIEEKRRKMREKYLRQYDPDAITDAEIVDEYPGGVLSTRRCLKTSNMKTDIEILETQYAKYKDKSGKKAKNLHMRIESFKALKKLIDIANSKTTASQKKQ